jgi:hypothetical protein
MRTKHNAANEHLRLIDRAENGNGGPTARTKDSLAVTQLKRIKTRVESHLHLPTEGPTAHTKDPPAVTQLKGIKARAERRPQANTRGHLKWQRPVRQIVESWTREKPSFSRYTRWILGHQELVNADIGR